MIKNFLQALAFLAASILALSIAGQSDYEREKLIAESMSCNTANTTCWPTKEIHDYWEARNE